jgi:hypothetical protein
LEASELGQRPGKELSGRIGRAFNRPRQLAYTEKTGKGVGGVGSVLMVCCLEGVGTRENIGELDRVVDQDGKVLGADPQTRTLIAERDKRELIRIPLTYQTSCLVIRHGDLSRLMGWSPK